MRYTSRKYAGLLLVEIGVMLLSRFLPIALWYGLMIILAVALILLLYFGYYN